MSSTSESHPHGTSDPYVAHHFNSWAQQRESASLGMWLFIAQEVMFFGGLFCAYAVYRIIHPEAFAFASETGLNVWLGGFNTAVLLTSSFTMALGVYCAQTGRNRRLMYAILATIALACVFLFVKLQWEYIPKFTEGAFPGANWAPHGHYAPFAAYEGQAGLQMFFVLYFIMTGMHALHMIIGMGYMFWLLYRAGTRHFGPRRYMAVENFGLYWHFVDIVWVFLFPMFYLVT
ncbi:MAG: cytochrome c oxidase subunit 3 family protein [Candidatus Hydrogenedentota bacterium]